MTIPDELLQQLKSSQKEERLEAASALGDFFETGRLDDPVAILVIEQLAIAASKEKASRVLNEILATLSLATRHNAFQRASLNPIAATLKKLDRDSLVSALGLLGASRCPAFREAVEQFRSHWSKQVRDAAATACAELT